MKKSKSLILGFSFILMTAASLIDASEDVLNRDITHEIPELTISYEGFKKVPDVAQYKEADWSNVIGVAKGVLLGEAIEIAKKHPEVTFFFHTKGCQVVLEKTDGSYRVFHEGDAVFFAGEPWWGSAPGFADGYIKE